MAINFNSSDTQFLIQKVSYNSHFTKLTWLSSFFTASKTEDMYMGGKSTYCNFWYTAIYQNSVIYKSVLKPKYHFLQISGNLDSFFML